MKHRLHTEIVIEAPPEAVWRVLTDLGAYRDWNPFMVSSAGEPVVGARLVNRMEPPGGKGMTFKPVVTAAEPPRVFEWLGRPGIPGVFDGRHRFELVPEGDGTRLVHTEAFSGVMVRVMRKSLDTHTMAGFRAMNEALKARVEEGVA